jgi:hypothetical protein
VARGGYIGEIEKGMDVVGPGIGFFAAILGLFVLSRYNYLAYHSLVELLGVTVAFAVFAVGWYTRDFARNSLLLVLAITYLAVGWLDLWHTMAYKGMGIFPGSSANMATQLWVVARAVEAVSLLFAAKISWGRHIRAERLLAVYVVLGVGLVWIVVRMDVFPVCYVEGVGLTTFKIVSECVITGVLAVAGALIWRRRSGLSPILWKALLAAVLATMISEACFTLYRDVYGFSNFLGHIFKLISVAFIYVSLVRGSLVAPYRSLFHSLSVSEAKYRQLFSFCVNGIVLLNVISDERGRSRPKSGVKSFPGKVAVDQAALAS